jgi:pimeloyl-ACP methyl ester carboxylesterase
MATNADTDPTRRLARPGGHIAFDVVGTGPLVVCAPGMGDLRSVYADLASDLAAAGFTVATMDLRGHGASDTTFSSYGDAETAGDLLALVDLLGGPAVLVGNSMSAAAGVLAAAREPAAVAGLVLIGPFVRRVPISRATRFALRVGLVRPWGPRVWAAYYAKTLNPGRKPAGLDAHVKALRAAGARPGAWRAFVATTRTTRDEAESVLRNVATPTLVVMGDADPDFPDPAAEAALVAERLGGTVLMVPGAGHYPQAQWPEVVSPRLAEFVAGAHA